MEPTEFQLLNFKNTLKLFNTLIGDKPYVTGNELTIADISLLASTTVLAINDFKDIEELPQLKSWYKRLENELDYFEEVNGDVQDGFKKLIEEKQPFYLHGNK